MSIYSIINYNFEIQHKYTTMHDVLDIIRNVQDLYSISPTLGVLKDFERVVDELDVYVFKNWDEGE